MSLSPVTSGNTGGDTSAFVTKTGQQGRRVSLAMSRSYQNKKGEWVNATRWTTLWFYGKLTERAAKITEGDRLFVQGSLDKEGVIVTSFETVPRPLKADTPPPVIPAG